MALIIEIVSVVLNLLFLVFLLKERIICWLFGILGSLTSMLLFYQSKLYSECILYSYYVLMGFYGYYLWKQKKEGHKSLNISKWSLISHLYILIVGISLSITMGYYFDNYTDAEKSYLDSATTIFSFIATYMEAKKVLSAWIFWIILNGLSIYLYFSRGLNIYALLALVYFVVSFYGYLVWKQKYNKPDYNVSI
ncbi:nicotinamide riboside transporter PnuC [Maribacter aurantiacus]|uniref:Nicotinamide riboside transporter PnuC n=1 Tax=Maribacter aurantiacus TaxID=1882343 RepID=A0A5R8M0M7_9FLAO|nr:nicotinamide mononucleotide transporter [Maribacter aurantiacus]